MNPVPEPAKTPFRMAFLLLPGYSFIAFSAAVEPLRMANQLRQRDLYRWEAITSDGAPVAASNGLRVVPNGSLQTLLESPPDLLLVCGGVDVQQACARDTLSVLRRLGRRRTPMGSVCTGAYVLAEAGVMAGYRCTLHWEHISSMSECLRFPETVFTTDLFVIDRDRYTCSGGVAPLDMMLNVIARQQGLELAEDIAEEFLHERIRDVDERQRMPLRVRLGTSQPKLCEVVTLMEANIHEPLTLDELAKHASISRRQLERLFRRYLGCSPMRYYLDLRLARARQLLLQTEMPITDIAIASGFVSPPHFTKCYHDRYDRSPRDERRFRRQRLMGMEAAGVLPTADLEADDSASEGMPVG